jgi:hypothetical protein
MHAKEVGVVRKVRSCVVWALAGGAFGVRSYAVWLAKAGEAGGTGHHCSRTRGTSLARARARTHPLAHSPAHSPTPSPTPPRAH